MAGIEPAKGRLTGACLYQHRPHRNGVRAVGFEPTLSCSRRRRTTGLSHTLKLKRPAGVEPALPPWQGSRLPLHHGRIESLVELSKIGLGLRPETLGTNFLHPSSLRPQACSLFLWDQRGSPPHRPATNVFASVPGARHAAASTLIPFVCFVSLRAKSARTELNRRPCPYKRPALNR